MINKKKYLMLILGVCISFCQITKSGGSTEKEQEKKEKEIIEEILSEISYGHKLPAPGKSSKTKTQHPKAPKISSWPPPKDSKTK